MEEMFDKSDKERQGLFFNGRDYLFFDKSNIKICKEIWQRHKNEVMRIWKSDISNSGKRPFTWWIVEAPEPKIKVKRIHKYYKYPDGQIVYTEAGDLKEERLEEETEREYLKRLNLLEEWEK